MSEVAVAPLRRREDPSIALAGCDGNQAVNPSSQPPSQVFAGLYEDYNPYDPTSCAQNNTGRAAAVEVRR
jgi:hypothetical protein